MTAKLEQKSMPVEVWETALRTRERPSATTNPRQLPVDRPLVRPSLRLIGLS
jgi:hypothetical protein